MIRKWSILLLSLQCPYAEEFTDLPKTNVYSLEALKWDSIRGMIDFGTQDSSWQRKGQARKCEEECCKYAQIWCKKKLSKDTGQMRVFQKCEVEGRQGCSCLKRNHLLTVGVCGFVWVSVHAHELTQTVNIQKKPVGPFLPMSPGLGSAVVSSSTHHLHLH